MRRIQWEEENARKMPFNEERKRKRKPPYALTWPNIEAGHEKTNVARKAESRKEGHDRSRRERGEARGLLSVEGKQTRIAEERRVGRKSRGAEERRRKKK
jgi:hypothetical protein